MWGEMWGISTPLSRGSSFYEAPVDMTKKQFAQMLGWLVEFWGYEKQEVARLAGVDRGTMYDHLEAKGQKLPSALRRRGYERAFSLPTGYLDTYHDRDEIRALHDTKIRDALVVYPPDVTRIPTPDALRQAMEDVADESGWLWRGEVEAEEKMRDVLRYFERTSVAMIGAPHLFTADEIQLNRLGLLQLAARQHVLAGKPVPRWLARLRQEVSDGSFH